MGSGFRGRMSCKSMLIIIDVGFLLWEDIFVFCSTFSEHKSMGRSISVYIHRVVCIAYNVHGTCF